MEYEKWVLELMTCIANYAMPYLSDTIALILARDRDKSSGIYFGFYLCATLCFLVLSILCLSN